MRASTSASQACGSTSLSRTVWIRVYITAARSPPRSEPANSHDFLPSAIPRSARSAALLVRQIRPSSRKRANASQRLVVHRFGNIGMPGKFGAFCHHPDLEVVDQRCDLTAANRKTFFNQAAIDLALDIKD